MESLIVSMNAMFPILILTAMGYILRKNGMVSPSTLGGINKLCFSIFLPILLFNNIYGTEVGMVIPWRLLAFCLIGILIVFFLLTLLTPLFIKDRKKQGSIIQGVFRSNFIILGMPIAIAICGPETASTIAILSAMSIPLYNFLAVVTLATHGEASVSYFDVVKKILKNPLIIFSIIGLIFYMLQIPLPEFAKSTLTSIGRVATPLSIIALGGSLDFSEIVGNKKILSICVLLKLIIIPIIVVAIAIFSGFRNIELVAILTLFATPTAISSFVMAQQMNCDGELAGEIVLLTSVFSCVTLFILIFILDFFAFV